jgi:PAS domain S-box-containing protein
LGLTYYVPVFKGIPWTLSFLVVVVVAWVAGSWPAAAVILVSCLGVCWLVLAPADRHAHDPLAFFRGVAFVAISSFVTFLLRQRRRWAASLQSSEMHYRSVTETASDVVITIDSGSQIISINPAVSTVFGYQPEELIGKHMSALMPEKFRAAHLGGIAAHLATGNRHIPWTGVQLPGLHKNGQEIPLEISFGSYVSEGKTLFTGFIRDMSERQRSQVALMQSEKLAAVGRLASSIAHEINNPLESITNLLFLARSSESVTQIHDYLDTAERELRRVSVIANQTLQLHKKSSEPAAVRCDELISGSLALYKGRLVNSHVVVQERMRARKSAMCVEGEMRQVLNNLIGNAIDALPSRGGCLSLRCRDATHWKTGRSGVVLTVADNGVGMSPETRKKIFDAFFSTKGSGGVGLGLWICCQLVEQNQGTLRVRSSQREGRNGTVFTVFLPASSESRSGVFPLALPAQDGTH